MLSACAGDNHAVHFVPRNLNRFDAVLERTELGPALVTTTSQTLSDLLMRPGHGKQPGVAGNAVGNLIAQVDATDYEGVIRQCTPRKSRRSRCSTCASRDLMTPLRPGVLDADEMAAVQIVFGVGEAQLRRRLRPGSAASTNPNYQSCRWQIQEFRYNFSRRKDIHRGPLRS